MENSKNVCVVVLGDLGRSPRMQYHSISLAEQGHKVDIICYQETRPTDTLMSQPLVNFHYLVPYPNIPCPTILNLIFKTLWQAITLLFVLIIIRKPKILLVQNPPAIPSLFICWIYSVIGNVKYVVDWHNYSHTILALNVGTKSLLVKLTEKLEAFAGRKASHNFCVTNEMREDLKENWNVHAVTLYDRPPNMFHPISLEKKHEVINCLSVKYEELRGTHQDETVFTIMDSDGTVSLKTDRPGLLISSTSWTEDEDFSLLLQALQDYEDHHRKGNQRKLPKLICVITGMGPLKHFYCEKFKQLKWQHTKVITPWLAAKDYPLLLASADLGVSLHTSSSGLDLPMKVVDMFGCGLPVCACNFKCLHELVKHGENSFCFKTERELSQQIQNWFEDFPRNTNQQELNRKFKTALEQFQTLRWTENWLKIAAHSFK